MFQFPSDEVKRKTFHLLSLIYIAAYWVLPKMLVLKGMGVVVIVVLAGDIVRLRIPAFNTWILAVLGGVHRKHETNNMSGLPWTLLGSFFTILLFPDRHIVMTSFMYLALGDAFAALFGKKFGKHKLIKNKTWEGSIACFLVCFVIGLLFLSWPLAILGAVIATVIEIVPWPLNDNFWMPLVSAAALTILVPIIKL